MRRGPSMWSARSSYDPERAREQRTTRAAKAASLEASAAFEVGGYKGPCPKCNGSGSGSDGYACRVCGGCGGLDESGAPINKDFCP